MNELKYDCYEDSIVGLLDMERLKQTERSRSSDYPHMIYDQEYLSFIQRNHGGVPKLQWFKTDTGRVSRLGRFINYGGPYTEPTQDDRNFPGLDIRARWSIGALETIANIADGCGAFLVPFGLLYTGKHSPDESGTTYINLLCFDYSKSDADAPEVVYWDNGEACDEFYTCQERGLDSWTEMRHEKFTDRAAPNFSEFMLSLRESEADLELNN